MSPATLGANAMQAGGRHLGVDKELSRSCTGLWRVHVKHIYMRS